MNAEKETPLIDLLRDVPEKGRAIYEVSKYESQSIPYGRLCHKAAAEIDRLQTENEALRNFLRPFAALLQEHNDKGRDDQPIFAVNNAMITLGDLRNARFGVTK